MDCYVCKFNNNCEPKTKAQWVESPNGEKGEISGCDKGELDREKLLELLEKG